MNELPGVGQMPFEFQWLALAAAASRLVQALQDDQQYRGNQKAIYEDLWGALSDGQIAAKGISRSRSNVSAGRKLDPFIFNRGYDYEDIEPLINNSEAWDPRLNPPGVYDVQVRWKDVVRIFELSSGDAALTKPTSKSKTTASTSSRGCMGKTHRGVLGV